MRKASDAVQDSLAKGEKPLSFVDQLIERAMPEEETFRFFIPAPINEWMVGRIVRDGVEFAEMKAAAKMNVEMLRDGGAPKEYAEYFTDDGELLGKAYAMSAMLVEPQIAFLDALKLARKAFPVFETIHQQLDQHQLKAVAEKALANIKGAKKKSGVTPSSEPG